MKDYRFFPVWILLLVTTAALGQKSRIYTDELVAYNHAISLYENRDYAAAQLRFRDIRDDFDEASELRARSYYYEAFCAIRLGQQEGEDLMNDFFERFPTSTKRNTAFLEVGDYYFNNRRYAYALKWFSKVNEKNLTLYGREDFGFRKGYSLFAVGSFTEAKKYFSQLLNSSKYGAQAKYYYGYMAYQADDYEEADKYLSEVSEGGEYDEEIDYYLVNIQFKTGKFQEAIEQGVPLLAKSKGIQHSELSKIIGESHFNLNHFEEAIPYLLDYQGKKGKWNNTDYYLLGYAYYMQQDYVEAINWFSKIIDGNNAVSQNAYYHLAECYLKEERKQEALNAFRNAQQMDFDPTIKKDAWVNYAKISYEIGNPYGSAAEVIQEYLAYYPEESAEREEMKELLISAYLGAGDYQGALAYLENSQNKRDETYQKVAFLYGSELYKEQRFSEALQYFGLAAAGTDETYQAKATFWRAETQYQLEEYDEALEGFKAFQNMEADKTSQEVQLLYYHMGYTFFQLQDYSQAGGHFNEFIEQGGPTALVTDSYIRLGDCFFALSNYYKAIPAYEQVVAANDVDVDYAQLQIAFCYGFMGEDQKKIAALNEFIQVHLKSTLRDDAYYELGNTYVKRNATEDALRAYQQVVQHYPGSSLVSRSLLKQGLVYFNSDRNDQALEKYKLVVEKYPGTDEAKEAVANAKQIYVEQGRVDQYEAFIRGVDFMEVSESDIESTMYVSAEQFYLTQNYNKAAESFEKYLERFPNGPNALTAHYYLADAYQRTERLESAVPHLKYLLERETNAYTERSLVVLSEYYLKDASWDQAMPLLLRLEEASGSNSNTIFAQSNLMKGYDATGDIEKARFYAEKVLQQEKIDKRVQYDAEIIIARSAFKSGNLEEARTAYETVGENATGEIKAETIYYDALFKHEDGNYKLSNVAIQQLASEYAKYRYWGGKGLVIMAKNFYALEDAYQATYILESVIQKFSEYEDVVEEARSELQKIKQEQAKTNSSVIIDNN